MLNSSDESGIQDVILDAIRRIAPEVDPRSIDPDLPLRDQVDLDSMDYLRLVVSVHEKLGIEIPESDYARIGTLRAFVAYVRMRLPPARQEPA